MAKSKPSTKAPVYHLKITLRDTQPAIWRSIEVPASTRLDHLNLMIQAAMGWTNSHLHSFTIDGANYAMHQDDFDSDMEDESRFRLDELVTREKTRFLYAYDFGDNWEHDVVVEKIMPPEAGVKYPRCTAGARACPPEDVGGVWGYVEFLEAIGDPEHEEHEAMLEWIGDEFDAAAFDLKDADAAVKDFKSMEAMM